ncbi:zinc transporter ZupT [Aquimarina sp. EL_43]|uniref:ZIP family metal transporter n=1 Tax=Aquimarina TaxID=290174 RepID=UPI000470F2CD|nr:MULTISPECIES: ZIP family metal transporter [Aquimarina]MBG6132706.1 zinc transporter ZupT [Aquimarina sp. EL_35]MBG6152836.1 zinc transporter ZupT [Aquimarina sp. EL_32]MBG6170843.1 zinc transporter ZupT [Aquimarina sp. EL_43]
MYNYILSITAVFIGALLVFIFKTSNQKSLKLLLAFSGAFLLAITIFDLLPEVFEDNLFAKRTGVWIMIGILLQKVLEYFSKGAEHGHIHLHEETRRIPKLLFISLGLHAILEGFPIHHTDGILLGIIIHKIPIAMILTTFLLNTKIKKSVIIISLTLFALMTPLGTFISENFTMIQNYYKEITALVIGIFLHVSTTILFESNEGHKFNITKLMVILIATVTAYII